MKVSSAILKIFLITLCLGVLTAHKLATDGGDSTVDASSQETAQSNTAAQVTETAEDPASVKPLPKKPFNLADFQMEIVLGVVLILYIINFFVGKGQNKKIAEKWLKVHKEAFEENFETIGMEEGGKLLDAESFNNYRFYASGRINCHYAMATIETKRRQDLLSMSILSFIWPQKDRYSLEIPLTNPNIPAIFALVRRKHIKQHMQNYLDIESLAVKRPCEGLNDNLAILSEHDEIIPTIMDERVLKMFNKFERYIQMVHLTDQKMFSNYDVAIRFDFLLPPNEKLYEDFVVLTKVAFYIADKLSNYNMSPAVRAKAEKTRKAIHEKINKRRQEEKVEEAQRKKVEDKKKKDEELAGKMTKEQLRKKEEKEYRQSLKKRQSKMGKVQMVMKA